MGLKSSDQEIKHALQLILERMKIIVEPSSATVLAAVMKNKKEFSSCVKICSGLFFSRILFDYLIEETIFETRRPERLFAMCLKFSKSFHNLKHLNCAEIVGETLKNVITRPVITS
mgnify:CR=1 FL=1